MKEYNCESIARKYKKKSLFWIRAALIISIFILFLPMSFIAKLLVSLAVFFIISAVSVTILRNTLIEPVLLKGLDPQGYRELIHSANIVTRYALEDIKALYFMGEYEETIRLCREKLADPKCKIQKITYLQFLARIYFDLDDLSALENVCNEFEAEIKGKKNEEDLRRVYVVFAYFKKYLCGDTEGCRTLYEGICKDPKYTRFPLTEIQVKYLYAVALAKTNEKDKAREIFEDIEKRAPYLNYSRLARKQIVLIDNPSYDGDYELNYVAEKRDIPTLEEPKKAKPDVWVAFALCMAVIVGCSVYTSIGSKPVGAMEAVEKKDAVVCVLAELPVNDSADMLYLYENDEGEICCAYLDCKGEGRYVCRIILDGLETDALCTVSAADCDLKIHFELYESLEDAPDDAYECAAASVNGRELYFCISKLEERRIFFYSSTMISTLLTDAFSS